MRAENINFGIIFKLYKTLCDHPPTSKSRLTNPVNKSHCYKAATDGSHFSGMFVYKLRNVKPSSRIPTLSNKIKDKSL